MTALTTYHKPEDLKHDKFILSLLAAENLNVIASLKLRCQEASLRLQEQFITCLIGFPGDISIAWSVATSPFLHLLSLFNIFHIFNLLNLPVAPF